MQNTVVYILNYYNIMFVVQQTYRNNLDSLINFLKTNIEYSIGIYY